MSFLRDVDGVRGEIIFLVLSLFRKICGGFSDCEFILHERIN